MTDWIGSASMIPRRRPTVVRSSSSSRSRSRVAVPGSSVAGRGHVEEDRLRYPLQLDEADLAEREP
jgi:hypothetical protein